MSRDEDLKENFTGSKLYRTDVVREYLTHETFL